MLLIAKSTPCGLVVQQAQGVSKSIFESGYGSGKKVVNRLGALVKAGPGPAQDRRCARLNAKCAKRMQRGAKNKD